MESPGSSRMDSHRSSEMDTHRSSLDGSVRSTSSAESRRSLRVHIEESRALPSDLKPRMLETLSMGSSSNRSTPCESPYSSRSPSPPGGRNPETRADSPQLQSRRQALAVTNVALGFKDGKVRASANQAGVRKKRKKVKAFQSIEEELAQLAAANRASLARAHAHRVLRLPSSRLLEDSVHSELAFRQALAAQLESLASQRAQQRSGEVTPEVRPEGSVDLEAEREYVQRLRARTPEMALDLRALFLRRLTGDHAPMRGIADDEGRISDGGAGKREPRRSRFAGIALPTATDEVPPLEGIGDLSRCSSKQKRPHLSKLSASLKSVTGQKTKRSWGVRNDPRQSWSGTRSAAHSKLEEWSSASASEADTVKSLPGMKKKEEEDTGPVRVPFRTIFSRKSPFSDWLFEHQLEPYRPKEVVSGVATPVLIRSRSESPKPLTPKMRTLRRLLRKGQAGSSLSFELEGSQLSDEEGTVRKRGRKGTGSVSPRLRLLDETDSRLFKMEGSEFEAELSENMSGMQVAGQGQFLPNQPRSSEGTASASLPPQEVGPDTKENVQSLLGAEMTGEAIVPQAKVAQKRARKKRRSSGPSPELLASLEKARQAREKLREKLPRLVSFKKEPVQEAPRRTLPARAHERPTSGRSSAAQRRPESGRRKASKSAVGGKAQLVAGRGGPAVAGRNGVIAGSVSAVKGVAGVQKTGIEEGTERRLEDPQLRKGSLQGPGGETTGRQSVNEGESVSESSDDEESVDEEEKENLDEEKKADGEPKVNGDELAEKRECVVDEQDDSSGDDRWEDEPVDLDNETESAPKSRGFESQVVEVPAPMWPRRVGGAGRDEG
jgi:hypothetical protein